MVIVALDPSNVADFGAWLQLVQNSLDSKPKAALLITMEPGEMPQLRYMACGWQEATVAAAVADDWARSMRGESD